MRPSEVEQKAKDFDISLDSAFKIRTRYLLQLVGEWDDYIDEKTNTMPELTTMDILDEIIKIKRYQKMKAAGTLKKDITDDMIQAARDYPIENLIEFNRGKALCFMHPDKAPSLSYYSKTNTARCFVCNKSVNALDVLILRDGQTFVEAVKQLSGVY